MYFTKILCINVYTFQRITMKYYYFRKIKVCSLKMECFSCIIHTTLQNMNSLTTFKLL